MKTNTPISYASLCAGQRSHTPISSTFTCCDSGSSPVLFRATDSARRRLPSSNYPSRGPMNQVLRRSHSFTHRIVNERPATSPRLNVFWSTKLRCDEWGCTTRVQMTAELSQSFTSAPAFFPRPRSPLLHEIPTPQVQPPSTSTPHRTPHFAIPCSPWVKVNRRPKLPLQSALPPRYQSGLSASPQTAITAITPASAANIPYHVYISSAQAPTVSSDPLQRPLVCARVPLYLPAGPGPARNFEICRIAASLMVDGPAPAPSTILPRSRPGKTRRVPQPLKIETGVLNDAEVRRIQAGKKSGIKSRKDVGLGISV